MQRRSYLRATAAVGTAGATAGCLGGLFESGPENVVLDPPEDQAAESSALAYPAYGESFPEFRLPRPFGSEPFSSADVEKPALYTAFYAFCPAECLLLMGSFANVQATLAEEDRLDEALLVAITFDPARDTAEALDRHAEETGIRHEHDSWQYLRPESPDRAKTVVNDRLGIGFQKTGGGDAYDFTHLVLTFLVNPDGVVERAYRGERLDVARVVSDLETVADAYA